MINKASTHLIKGELSQLCTLLESKPELIHAKNEWGSTLLIQAIEEVNIPAVKQLLDLGADVNLLGKEECSPLYYAVTFSESMELVKLLVLKGAHINAQDKEQCSLLYSALLSYNPKKNSDQIISFLLEQGANPSLVNKQGINALNLLSMPKNKGLRQTFQKHGF